MRILFITHHYLSENGGGSFASRAYINAFAAVAEEMTLLYPVSPAHGIFDEVDPKIRLVPVAYSYPKPVKLLHQIFGKVHRFFEAAPKEIASGNYDIVVFDNSRTSFRLIDLAHKHGCKTIVINHNYEYEYVRDNSKGLMRPISLYWTRRYENDAAVKSDLGLTLTRQDMKLLCDEFRGGNQSNFDLLGTFEFASNEKKTMPEGHGAYRNFVITGNLSAMQTVESLVPWIRNCFPLLRNAFPDSELTIAGRNPGETITSLCAENGIKLIPSPVSMDPIMSEADCYICPTALGGGIKLRVMDGLKWGVPVICHSVSARGYDLFEDKGCLISYSNEEGFARALEKLKTYQGDKQHVYETYRSIFSFEAGCERVKEIVKKLS